MESLQAVTLTPVSSLAVAVIVTEELESTVLPLESSVATVNAEVV